VDAIVASSLFTWKTGGGPRFPACDINGVRIGEQFLSPLAALAATLPPLRHHRRIVLVGGLHPVSTQALGRVECGVGAVDDFLGAFFGAQGRDPQADGVRARMRAPVRGLPRISYAGYR